MAKNAVDLVFAAGSVFVDDLRKELKEADLPEKPLFVIRLSHQGPASVTTLALQTNLIIDKPHHAGDEGRIIIPINSPLLVGQRLAWTVFAGFDIPTLGAYLFINKKIKPLSSPKKKLKAGGLWPAAKILTSQQLG